MSWALRADPAERRPQRKKAAERLQRDTRLSRLAARFTSRRVSRLVSHVSRRSQKRAPPRGRLVSPSALCLATLSEAPRDTRRGGLVCRDPAGMGLWGCDLVRPRLARACNRRGAWGGGGMHQGNHWRMCWDSCWARDSKKPWLKAIFSGAVEKIAFKIQIDATLASSSTYNSILDSQK
jgi:hypothetical protein